MSTNVKSTQEDVLCSQDRIRGESGNSPDLNSTSFEFNAGEREIGEEKRLYEKQKEKYGSV